MAGIKSVSTSMKELKRPNEFESEFSVLSLSNTDCVPLLKP